MSFDNLIIGYVPNHPELLAPSDNRRFIYYAKHKNISFEIANIENEYDILILNPSADLTLWKRKKNKKVIFELIDSLLSVDNSGFKNYFRGAAKYYFRRHKYLEINYQQTLKDVCSMSDAVICSNNRQKNILKKYCKNINTILDFHEDVVKTKKKDFKINDTVHVVWEGLASGNEKIFEMIENILGPLSKKYIIELHVITDIEYGKYMNNIYKQYLPKTINKIFRDTNIKVNLYQWNINTFSYIATQCDLAIIPIPNEDLLMMEKPENKLLLFWRLGIPTFVSPTYSYADVMDKCQLDMVCKSNKEWHLKISDFIQSEQKRIDVSSKIKDFMSKNYTLNTLIKSWDYVFNSIM